MEPWVAYPVPMDFLIDLWLPILASAVGVFFASSLLHMVLPIHRSDYRQLPDEEAVCAALRAGGAGPGHYVLPYCMDFKEMAGDEMQAKFNQGPVGFLTLKAPGMPQMGKTLGQWFVYSAFIATWVAYVADLSLNAGAGFTEVFRTAGTVGVLAYAFGTIPESIWKGLPWSVSLKYVFDGLTYGLVTGAVFGLLWPGA